MGPDTLIPLIGSFMKTNRLRACLVGLVLLGCGGTSAWASSSSLTISNISYVSWSSAVAGPAGSATGLMISNLVGQIRVDYRGEVAAPSQIGPDGGIDYWNPGTPYLSTVISNLPPTKEIIALSGVGLNTLEFSEPVVDPVLLIVSMGQPSVGVTYTFDANFQVLSQGAGYWGNGQLFASEPNVLLGLEGHGAIQFPGVHRSLSWQVEGAEHWHGFTVGIPVDPSGASPVPDGLFGMAAWLCLGAWACARSKG